MGWSPAAVRDASLWEIECAFAYWLQAQGTDAPDIMTDAEADALMAKWAHI